MAYDYSQTFVLGERFIRGAVRVCSVGDIPDVFALTRAEVSPRGPVEFRIDEGRVFYDLIGTTWAVLDLLSDRAMRVFAEGRFTGWTTYPIEIRNKAGAVVPGYQGLAVTGRCGPIDDSLSPIEVLPPPVPTGRAMPHRLGLRFHPETWDGSDVFTPDGTGFVFVTVRVRDALVAANLTNLTLRPLSEVHRLVLGSSGAQAS